jgi:D-alanyl-D-alanine carboxypeptidase (penicillin-binding protein 5/6)
MLLGLPLAAVLAIGPAPARAASAVPSRPTGLHARAAYLFEIDNDTPVFALQANAKLPIASTTKLMTAYVTLANVSLGHVFVERPYAAQANESLAGLRVGDHYSVADLLRAMLIPSGGDAANTLAISVGGSVPRFVAMMNAAAVKLGLTDTHYTTPVGLDTPGNYSTAVDLERLAQILMRNPFFAKVVSEPEAELHSGLVVRNTDDLIGAYPWVVGVKTGHTEDAGYCLIGAASDGGVHLISVVLGDPSNADRDADTLTLLRYGLHLYRSLTVAVEGHTYLEASVSGGAQDQVALVAQHSAKLVASRATTLGIALSSTSVSLSGPLPAGSVEDAINVTENGKTVLSVPLVTASAISGSAAASDIGIVIAGIVVMLAAGCSLLIMRTRARRRSGPGSAAR